MFSLVTSTFLCGCQNEEAREKALHAMKKAAWMDIATGIIFLVLGALATSGYLPPIGEKIFYPLSVLSVLMGIGILKEHPTLVVGEAQRKVRLSQPPELEVLDS